MTDPPAEENAPLPQAVREALLAFARSAQTFVMYPSGHPERQRAVERALDALEPAWAGNRPLVVDVHRTHVTVDDEGGPDQAEVLRELARHLYAHRVARLEFHPGVDEGELGSLLDAVSRDPGEEGKEGEAAALRPDGAGWTNVEVVPLEYDGLVLGGAADDDERADVDEVWAGLVRHLASEGAAEEPSGDRWWTDVSVATLATRLEDLTAEEAQKLEIGNRLGEVAEALARRAGGGESAGQGGFRPHFTELLHELSGETLRSLFSELSEEEIRDFLRSCARALPVRSAAPVVGKLFGEGDPGATLTLRLLAKLDRRRGGGGWTPPEGRLRSRLDALIDAGTEGRDAETVEEPSSDGTAAPMLPGGEGATPEAGDVLLHVLQAALATGTVGPGGRAGVRELVDAGRAGEVVAALREAPDASGEARRQLLEALDVRQAVRRMLLSGSPDLDPVRQLVGEAGDAVVPAVIDVLADSGTQELRRRTFSLLEEVGQPARPHLLDRLHSDERWFVQRNMLALLASLAEPPEADRVEAFRDHDRAAVRIEAYKLLLDRDAPRVEDLRRALGDSDRRVVSLGVGAAADSPRDELAPDLAAIAADEERPDDTRRAAVGALSRLEHPTVVETLTDLCSRERSWWRFWASEAVRPNPVARAALRGLARHHRDRPEVRNLLEAAADSSDERVRAVLEEEGP